MTTILTLLLVAVAAVFVVWPFLRETESETSRTDPLAALEAKKNEALQGLKEADFDLQMGKLTTADHALLQQRLREQALSAIAAIEEAKQGTKQETTRSTKPARVSFCPSCGASLPTRAKFCGGCGTDLRALLEAR